MIRQFMSGEYDEFPNISEIIAFINIVIKTIGMLSALQSACQRIANMRNRKHTHRPLNSIYKDVLQYSAVKYIYYNLSLLYTYYSMLFHRINTI